MGAVEGGCSDGGFEERYTGVVVAGKVKVKNPRPQVELVFEYKDTNKIVMIHTEYFASF